MVLSAVPMSRIACWIMRAEQGQVKEYTSVDCYCHSRHEVSGAALHLPAHSAHVDQTGSCDGVESCCCETHCL